MPRLQRMAAGFISTQGSGQLGQLDPETGKTHHISLGQGSAPHGVIVGPDGAPGSPMVV